jgi:hypothetical protein
MCMFCAAIPVAAATGVSLDSKQRRCLQAQGRESPRLRPVLLLTGLVLLFLMAGSVIFHTYYPRLW